MKCKWIFLLIFLLVGSACWAGGQELFVKKCGSCHHKGGQAPPINPADKAGLVWKKYFKRRRHPIDLSQHITADELKEILSYLQEHAADSEQPEAAIIPK